jgi:hypothetical protein
MTDIDRGFAAGWHDDQYANRHRRMPPDWTPPDMITQAEAAAKARRAFARGIFAAIVMMWIAGIVAGWLM